MRQGDFGRPAAPHVVQESPSRILGQFWIYFVFHFGYQNDSFLITVFDKNFDVPKGASLMRKLFILQVNFEVNFIVRHPSTSCDCKTLTSIFPVWQRGIRDVGKSLQLKNFKKDSKYMMEKC